MARTPNPLNTLTAGGKYTLHLHGSKMLGNDPYDLPGVTFLRYTGEGANQRAVFDEIELYKVAGRWCYGMSAERASLIQ